MTRVLVVDDDRALVRSLEIHLSTAQYIVRTAHTLAEAWSLFSPDPDDIIFLDLKLPDGDSRSLLSRIREAHPETPVIMISGHQDMQATIEAIQTGAFDYIRKPLDLNQILATLAKAEESIQAKPRRSVAPLLTGMSRGPREIVGRSPATLNLLKQIAVLSQSRVTVLIQGETGTGKELVARALHQASGRAGPFVAVNCGGIVPTLLESELFGHEKGSFTGAGARKLGKLELAGAGTIFFDEIGDLPFDLQAKLLRALQEAEFERVGGTQPIQLRARVLAATHRDLDAETRAGTFRQDLFFRLAVARMHVPPLRQRPEDIPLLAEFLLGRIADQLERPPLRLSAEALVKLQNRSWPGNVRELENVLTRAAAVLRTEVISPEDLQFDTQQTDEDEERDGPQLTLREAERRHIVRALERLDWNITHTAEALGISPTTLRKKIADYDLRRRGEAL